MYTKVTIVVIFPAKNTYKLCKCSACLHDKAFLKHNFADTETPTELMNLATDLCTIVVHNCFCMKPQIIVYNPPSSMYHS